MRFVKLFEAKSDEYIEPFVQKLDKSTLDLAIRFLKQHDIKISEPANAKEVAANIFQVVTRLHSSKSMWIIKKLASGILKIEDIVSVVHSFKKLDKIRMLFKKTETQTQYTELYQLYLKQPVFENHIDLYKFVQQFDIMKSKGDSNFENIIQTFNRLVNAEYIKILQENADGQVILIRGFHTMKTLFYDYSNWCIAKDNEMYDDYGPSPIVIFVGGNYIEWMENIRYGGTKKVSAYGTGTSVKYKTIQDINDNVVNLFDALSLIPKSLRQSLEQFRHKNPTVFSLSKFDSSTPVSEILNTLMRIDIDELQDIIEYGLRDYSLILSRKELEKNYSLSKDEIQKWVLEQDQNVFANPIFINSVIPFLLEKLGPQRLSQKLYDVLFTNKYIINYEMTAWFLGKYNTFKLSDRSINKIKSQIKSGFNDQGFYTDKLTKALKNNINKEKFRFKLFRNSVVMQPLMSVLSKWKYITVSLIAIGVAIANDGRAVFTVPRIESHHQYKLESYALDQWKRNNPETDYDPSNPPTELQAIRSELKELAFLTEFFYQAPDDGKYYQVWVNPDKKMTFIRDGKEFVLTPNAGTKIEVWEKWRLPKNATVIKYQ